MSNPYAKKGPAANKLAGDLQKRVYMGATAMEKELEKNYQHLMEVPVTFLLMFCRGRAAACVRAVLPFFK